MVKNDVKTHTYTLDIAQTPQTQTNQAIGDTL